MGWGYPFRRRLDPNGGKFFVQCKHVSARTDSEREAILALNGAVTELQMSSKALQPKAGKEVRNELHVSPEADLVRDGGSGVRLIEAVRHRRGVEAAHSRTERSERVRAGTEEHSRHR